MCEHLCGFVYFARASTLVSFISPFGLPFMIARDGMLAFIVFEGERENQHSCDITLSVKERVFFALDWAKFVIQLINV